MPTKFVKLDQRIIQPAMTTTEIAAALGCDPRRISYEIRYALTKFKAEFEKRGYKMTDLIDPHE